jgi:glycine cleavage system H protein
MDIFDDLLYTSDHEWVRIEGNLATIGITDFAQKELGDIVYIDINTLSETLEQHDIFGTVEAVKTVSDLFMPVSGTVVQVNEGLGEHPELVNSDCYGKGWMIKIEMNADDTSHLLSAEAYRKIIGA